MSVNAYKIKYLSQKAQLVLFTNTGQCIDSCDTLLNMSECQGVSLFEAFPFLDSLRSSFADLSAADGEMYFPRVEFPHKDKYWIFDFTFYRSDIAPYPIVWVIQDFTRQYQYLFDVQQERNESIVKEEIRKSQSQSLNLQKDIKYLNSILKLKLEYIAKLTYNIKYPVQEIGKRVNLLSDTLIYKEEQTNLKGLQGASEALNLMLEEMLELSKIDISRTNFEPKRFLLPEVLWTVIKTFDYNSLRKHVPVRLFVANNVPQRLWGDDTRLAQILHNLLQVALKYTEKGQIDIAVELLPNEVRADGVALQFVITDTGTLIEPEILSKIFSTSTNVRLNDMLGATQGIGLNLLIAKQLIVLQNGTLHIENIADAGNTYTVKLNYKLPEPVMAKS